MYEDIINMKHHVSLTKPHMSTHDRAAQFAPFSALSGYDEIIDETKRQTQQEKIIDDNFYEELQLVFCEIKENIEKKPLVKIEFFVKDEKKDGGKYITLNKHIVKIDESKKIITLEDGEKIEFKSIINIELY